MKNKLLREGVRIRSRSEQNVFTNKKRAYNIDHNYFSNITTVNQAWLLGFLASDGYIHKNDNGIKIGLQQKDREILETIKKEIKSEHPIRGYTTKKGYHVCEIVWSSEQQKKDLAKYGIINRKTYSGVRLPQFDNDNLTLAYILGYIDGDGSIRVAPNYTSCVFSICSYKPEILHDFGDFFNKKYGISVRYYQFNPEKKHLYSMTLTSKDSYKILTDMYNLNSIRLQRKYDSYLSVKTKRL